MSPELITFIYEVLNFLVLAAALSWLLFKPVRQALIEQRAKFDATAAEAARKLAEAEAARTEIESTRRQLQEDLNQMRARELGSARQAAEQLIANARATAHNEHEMLRRQADQMVMDENRKIAETAATAAATMVEQLLVHIHGPDLDTALVQAACEQLQELHPELLAPVKVESAFPLSNINQAAIKTALASAAHQTTFLIDDSLGAGVRIATGDGLIDASARGLAQYARQSLIKQLEGVEHA